MIQSPIVRGLILAILLSCAIFVIKRNNFRGDGNLDYYGMSYSYDKVFLDQGGVKQYFGYMDDIKKIYLLAQSEATVAEDLKLQIYEVKDDQLIAETQIAVPAKADTKIDRTMEEQVLEIPITLHKKTDIPGKKIPVYMVLTGAKADNQLSVCVSRQPKEDKDGFYNPHYEHDKLVDGRVRMAVICTHTSMGMQKILVFLVLLAASVILFVPWKDFWNPQKAFLVIALVGGVTLAVLNPMGQECDGWDHYMRALDVSTGNVLNPFVCLTHEADEIVIPKNAGALEVVKVPANSCMGTWMMLDNKSTYYEKELITTKYTGGVTSLYYLPQGLGLFLGRMLGLSVYATVILARVLSLLVYIALVYQAIRRMPFLKNLMLVIAIMPLSLYQAASFSSDALLNGLCMLFIAVCFQYAIEDRRLGVRQGLFLTSLLLYIFVGKYVYVVLGLLVFIIPKERFGTTKDYFKAFGIALIPMLLVGGFLALHLSGSVASMQGTTAGGMTQTQYVMQNPVRFIKVMINTVELKFTDYMWWMDCFGWLEYPLGFLIYAVPCMIIAVACLDSKDRIKELKVQPRVFSILVFALVFVAIMLGMYIGDPRFNEVGAAKIEGVQGRYFIPILILPFITCKSTACENHIERFTERVAGIMGLFLAYSCIRLAGYCY